MRLFRIGAGLAALFAIALAARGDSPGTLPIGPIIGAAALVVLVVLATWQLENEGLRAAADEAPLLTDLLIQSLQ